MDKMPRKVRVPASRVENRQNQQRSRERHREYVAGLEKRLSEYEVRGAQATVEMQNAARAVAVKNERLMALLALHGVQRDEIDAFLDTADVTYKAPFPPSLPIDYDMLNGHKAEQVHPIHVPAAKDGDVPQPPTTTTHQNRDVSSVDIYVTAAPGPNIKSLLSGFDNKMFEPSFHYSDNGQVPKEPSSHESAREVTSCEDAASILASLRGHGDVYEARSVLGCAPWASCSVKNTRLFQLMNEVP